MDTKKINIIAVASAGGHWVQLSRLSPFFDKHNVTYITTNQGHPTSELYNIHCVIDGNDKERIKCLLMFFQIFKIMILNKPDLVISTGAAPGFFAIFLSKLFLAKSIWIDSIANIDKLSLSGRMVKKYADVRLTQWPHLVDENEGIKYWGKVL